MAHLGDFDTSAVVYGKFTTYRPSTGAPHALAGTPALSVYKDNSTTQSTTGVTLTADFDTVTGLNHFAIDTSADGTFYAAGSFFDVVITTGTVDSVSVVGSVVGSFTLRKNSALKPTTAARTLDVASTGEAGIDLDNILFSGNGPLPAFGIIDRGTAQAADATSITLRSGFSTAAANMVGVTAWVYSSTNGLHARGLSTAYNNTTKVLTISGLGEAPTGTVLYALFATAPGSALSVNLEDNAISASKIATDAFTAAKFAGDVTTELQSGLATASALSTLDGKVDTIDNFLDTELAAVLALLDDPRGEPGQGAPPVNPDLATKIDYLYKAWRNRSTQTASEYALYADDGTTKDQEAACSDDGTTFVRGEVTTGA